MNNQNIIDAINQKKVLYIATKNSNYIRIKQEVALIDNATTEAKYIISSKKNYLLRCLEVYWQLLTTDTSKFDVVFVSFMAQMVVPFFKPKFKNKYLIVDMFISVFDTLVDDRKKFKANSIIGRILHKIDRNTVNNCDMVISDTMAHGEYFSQEFGISKENIQTLYLKANTSIYRPMEIERPDELKGKFLVLYFGSILPVQGVDIILNSISDFNGEPTIQFVIIGPIPKKYNKPEQKNVTYIDWLSEEELAKYISYADLCLAGHFNDTVGKAQRTIPGKAYIYKAMNKRVVFGDSRANRELFEENSDNLYVKMGDSKALSNKIKSVMLEGTSF